jgi:hypothetical protein
MENIWPADLISPDGRAFTGIGGFLIAIKLEFSTVNGGWRYLRLLLYTGAEIFGNERIFS